MAGIVGIISVGLLLSAGWLIARCFRPQGMAEWLIIGFLAATAQVVLGGVILSGLDLLSSVNSWAVLNLAGLLLALAGNALLGHRVMDPVATREPAFSINGLFGELDGLGKWILIPLISTALLTGLLNAAVAVFTAPHHWDSLVSYLTRMAYWLQHGNFEYYPAQYWAQITYQKTHSLLHLYAFLAAGRGENFTQLVQYLAYWISVLSVYGITRRLGLKRSAALFSALVFSLLTECLMQSTTNQSDMLLTAYLGATVYFLLSYSCQPRGRDLVLAGAGLGLAVATKPPAALLLPPVALIAAQAVWTGFGPTSAKLRAGLLLLAVSLAAVAVFALPTGYLDNLRMFGHPLGPQEVVAHHTFARRPPAERVRYGTKNLFRYVYDFIALDGLPPVTPFREAQSLLKSVPETVFTLAGIRLEAEEGDGVREGPFIYGKPPYSHADYSYWGILGFALLWPAVFLVLFGLGHSVRGRLLAIGALLFLLLQAYSGDYEPARGRYFIQAGIFAAPLAGYLFESRNRVVRGYLAVIAALGCLSALTAVIFRERSPLLGPESIFCRTRLEQMSRSGIVFRDPIGNFEKLVPPDAVVAACLNPNSFEYPLFGRGLTRTVIPLNSFRQGLQPVPPEADYLLWAGGNSPDHHDDFDFIFNRTEGDVHLGKDWWLRRLR